MQCLKLWGWNEMVIDHETIIYILEFLVPGFIITTIQETITPSKQYSDNERMIHAVGYSVLNLCIWYWLFLIIHHFIINEMWYWTAHSIAIFITGSITGIALGLIKKKELIKWLFSKFDVTVVHPIPRAWDYIFSNDKTYWIEVFLENGKIVRGYYSANSFTSSDSNYNDIYVEKLYKMDKDGKWDEVERTSGVWISPAEIKYIKFYNEEDNKNVE